MVRLKVWKRVQAFWFIQIFQFQYGAIKSVHIRVQQKHTTVFQFQYGAIKSSLKHFHLSMF